MMKLYDIIHISNRFVLVKYSDRGLIQNGELNLKLFNSLHWVVFFTLSSISFGVFPLSKQMKGRFPENSIKGQICMKIDFELDETNIKQRIYTFIIPLVLTIFLVRFSKSMKNCVKRQNLNMKTFSQYLGKHQRNIFTAKETLCYFLF